MKPKPPRSTIVINIYAGPGAGKSTLTCALFAEMKIQQKSVELVREYVKTWAWRGQTIGRWDQVYLYAKQLRAESALYGKVDYLIADCPLGLNAVYEQVYPTRDGSRTMLQLFNDIRLQQQSEGIRHLDLLIQRTKPYVQEGRYEDEQAAREVDGICGDVFPHLISIQPTVAAVLTQLEMLEHAS